MWCGNCYRSREEPKFFGATSDHDKAKEGDDDRIETGWITKKTEENRFCRGRDGDDLMVSFECDFCIFGKLFDHEPQSDSVQNKYALACIRRINLDALWSRAPTTVRANTLKMREGLEISWAMGMRGFAMESGPLPGHDHVGYEVGKFR